MNKYRTANLITFIGSLFCSYLANASDVQFNEQALAISGISDIDLSSFEKNSQSEGSYVVGVSVNGRKINYLDQINFVNHADRVQACLPEKLIKIIGLKDEFIKEIPQWNEGECFDLAAQNDNIQVNFDDERQEIALSIPQAYFLYNDDNWVPPQQRDNGINALIFDYSVMNNYVNNGNQSNYNNLSSYGTVGANIDRWRFRSNYQYQKDFSNSYNDNFQWVQTYAFTDLPGLHSKLFVGNYYTAGNIFDSVRFNGVSVFSDDNMLPVSLRGYAPNVTGTATSNATVVVSQNGRVLTQVKVSPGPFSIDNLSSSLSGTLDVKITEEDGSVRQYQVSTTSIPFLTRPGMVSYKMNAGQLNPFGNKDVDSKFLSTEASWGALNNASVYGGVFSTADSEYLAYSLGLGINMEQFGALSFDVTQSKSHLEDSGVLKGESYRLNYAKRLSDTSRLNLTGYQFSSEDFTSVNHYIDIKSNAANASHKPKNTFSTSFTQQIPDWNADISLNYSKETYWDTDKSNNNINLAFNKTMNNAFLKDTLLTLSAGESTYSGGGRSKQAYLSLSVPLGNSSNSRVQYFGSYDSQTNNYNNNVNYFTQSGNNNLNFGVSSNNVNDNVVLNASAYRDTAYGTAQVSGAYNKDYQSLSTAFDNSITITQHGPVMHRKVFQNQARMIIDTDNAKDVSVNDDQAITNRFGLAGVSNVPAYYKSTQYIDINNMPKNVSIEDNVIESTLTDGAVGYSKVNAVIGEKALVTIKLSDGTSPPFGALVYDRQSDKELGMISEQGQAYLTGLRNSQTLRVKWSGDQACLVTINTASVQTLNVLTCYKG